MVVVHNKHEITGTPNGAHNWGLLKLEHLLKQMYTKNLLKADA